MIAALYIDPRGPYANRPGVDAWDEARDARTYNGPWPVVAHPPCGPWSKLRHLWTGDAGEKECGPAAVLQVQRWGGVLEHPAHSLLFEEVRLPKPGAEDLYGFTVAVNQVSWGHPCVKPTWLYVVDVPAATVLSGLRTGGEPTHCICTGPRQLRRLPVASAQKKRRTPPAFADWLISLAEQANRRAV